MATEHEVSEALVKAKLAVLNRIERAVEMKASGSSVRDLAEAYAWLVSPNQSHGGSTNVSK